MELRAQYHKDEYTKCCKVYANITEYWSTREANYINFMQLEQISREKAQHAPPQFSIDDLIWRAHALIRTIIGLLVPGVTRSYMNYHWT